jgi:hypothetical protein
MQFIKIITVYGKMTPNNYKQIKYQPTKEEKPTKYQTTNKSQPEPAQVDNPNPNLKIK